MSAEKDPAAVAAEAELARLQAEADAAEAALRAAQARAKLAAARAAAAQAGAAEAAPAAAVGPADPVPGVEAAPAADATADPVPGVEDAPAADATAEGGPLPPQAVRAVAAAYAFDAPALDIGAVVNGDAVADARVRIPLAMLNRHGLVAGATGTGKTRTLQGLAEQLSAHGVPVFAADIKGDLSGMAAPGEPSEALLARARGIGQDWRPRATPVEFLALGGRGPGVPVRATVTGFGPLLLSKVLGLNATQESSLGLVFHYADRNGLPLVGLDDLRAVLGYLTSDDGKAELKELGGLSSATAGVILREIVALQAQGADVFFG